MTGSLAPKETVIRVQKEPMRKVLTVLDLFAIGYGDLGSSIYYALGITAVFALGATPLALLLAALVFVCTALTYAEMSSFLHESGGSASYARHAFNDLISFIAGWGLLLDYVVTIAISAFSVGSYLSYFFPLLSAPQFQVGLAVGLIVILVIMNIIGVRESTRLSFGLTCFTLVTQTVIIVIALGWLVDIKEVFSHLKINTGDPWSPSWPEFWKGTAMAMVAYTGIESIAQLGAEAKKPSKTVPKAILITMYIVVAMYLSLSVVALSALTPQQLGGEYQYDPIAGIVEHLPFGGSVLGPWMGLLAASLLFVAANAGIIGASRLSFNLGEYYQLPNFFYKLHPRFNTPHIALIVFALFAALIVVISRGNLDFLANLYNFGAMLAFTSAHMSLIILRIKQPATKRPFKIPLNISFGKFSLPISAIVGCLSTMSVWLLVVITKPDGRYLGLGWMAFGVLLYLFYRKKKNITMIGSVRIEKIAIPKDQKLCISKILVPIISSPSSLNSLSVACDLAKLYKAELHLVALHQIPHSIPIDGIPMSKDPLIQKCLDIAEAQALEFNIPLKLYQLEERDVIEPFMVIEKEEGIDLIITAFDKKKQLSRILDKIASNATCRVWQCH